MITKLRNAIVNLEGDIVLHLLKQRVEKGEDGMGILEECRNYLTIVGEQVKKGDKSLADLIVAGEMFREVFNFINPYINKINSPIVFGKVILATLEGDIHDLGKNILATLLKSRGFDVYDLGVNVDPKVVIENAMIIKPDFVGFSALITPNLQVIKNTIDLFDREGLRNQVKILIGGGATNPKVSMNIGADFQTIDAMEGLSYCINNI